MTRMLDGIIRHVSTVIIGGQKCLTRPPCLYDTVALPGTHHAFEDWELASINTEPAYRATALTLSRYATDTVSPLSTTHDERTRNRG